MTPERFVCIHGHFYQPPRENPWLEEIERQPSAVPYHDWNERITAECYAPNAEAGNYARISFNFGPTLLSWMEKKKPELYRAVLESDRQSMRNFSGHGSAIAQAYNHIILPLANRRDRVTQVAWGIRDFEIRFGRKPEGMWLPETAVDVESLEILAEQGILFTVLAPHQALGPVDTRQAYTVSLPSGRKIALFFYNGDISRAVAFEKLLASGEQFARRLAGAFDPAQQGPQLAHIAADGETYGHHYKLGDRALTACLLALENSGAARVTNYAEYLSKHPPSKEVEIAEKTSWSCSHGIDRWWAHCGCSSGAHPEWNQEWRTPLRNGLDQLRDAAVPLYEREAGKLFADPWAARDRYIGVVMDRSRPSEEAFFKEQMGRVPAEPERTTALKLLELQRNALLMYTSCGWFFDDISGIETVQVLQYAGRVIQLASELFGQDLEPPFLEILALAKSNVPEQGDGRRVYEAFVRKNLALRAVVP